MKKLLIGIAFILPLNLFAQDFDKIGDAFASADISTIAKSLDATVEFTFEGKEETIGRSDAENKLRSFFMSNSPRSFNQVHSGVSKNDVHYMIGELLTTSGVFRTTIYLAKSGENYLIQSLEIEGK
jgi:hypothetical protein